MEQSKKSKKSTGAKKSSNAKTSKVKEVKKNEPIVEEALSKPTMEYTKPVKKDTMLAKLRMKTWIMIGFAVVVLLLAAVFMVLYFLNRYKELDCEYVEEEEGQYNYEEGIDFYYDKGGTTLNKLLLSVEIELDDENYTKDNVKTYLEGAKDECKSTYGDIKGVSCKASSSGFAVKQVVKIDVNAIDEDKLYEMFGIDKNAPESYENQKVVMIEAGYTCK